MFIDSPQFPHRKVVHDKQHYFGGFGYERAQLANFVTDQLNNNHKNDAAILQKFRKQAQQYKKNLLRRKHNKPVETLSQPNFIPRSMIFEKQPSQKLLQSKPQYNPEPAQKLQTSNSEQVLKHHTQQYSSQKPQVIIRQVERQPNNNSQLFKMLQYKDKMIQKQNKIINKNERKMNELKRRIELLENQNKLKQSHRLASYEKESYDKIKGFISSMSNQLLQNKSLLQQNLVNNKSFRSPSLVQKNKSQIFQHQPSNHKVKAKKIKEFNPQMQQQALHPYIQYNYKLKGSNEMNSQKQRIKSFVNNLKTSRNRLDAHGTYLGTNNFSQY